MIEEIIDFISSLFEDADVEDIIETGSDIAGDALLIGGSIFVAHLTINSIQKELRNRKELKAKGATKAIIKEFIEKHGATEITFTAKNAKDKTVGTFKMRGHSHSGLQIGQEIAI